MHFGFALDFSDIDLWNVDLLDTHLDLLDTDITSKNFVCLRDILKTSSRYVFKTSWRRLEDQQMFAGIQVQLRLQVSEVLLLCSKIAVDLFYKQQFWEWSLIKTVYRNYT